MKHLLITAAVIALGAPIVSAGDLHFDLGIKKNHRGKKSVRVGVGYHDKHTNVHVGYRKTRHRHRDVHRHRHHRPRGRYVYETRRVWVPGHYDRVWHPAQYRWHYDRCGYRTRVLVRRGYHSNVWHPGHWKHKKVRVWRPYRHCR